METPIIIQLLMSVVAILFIVLIWYALALISIKIFFWWEENKWKYNNNIMNIKRRTRRWIKKHYW